MGCSSSTTTAYVATAVDTPPSTAEDDTATGLASTTTAEDDTATATGLASTDDPTPEREDGFQGDPLELIALCSRLPPSSAQGRRRALKEIKRLVRKRAPPFPINEVCPFTGDTALMRATMWGSPNLPVVRLLLDAGAVSSTRCLEGWTALVRNAVGAEERVGSYCRLAAYWSHIVLSLHTIPLSPTLRSLSIIPL